MSNSPTKAELISSQQMYSYLQVVCTLFSRTSCTPNLWIVVNGSGCTYLSEFAENQRYAIFNEWVADLEHGHVTIIPIIVYNNKNIHYIAAITHVSKDGKRVYFNFYDPGSAQPRFAKSLSTLLSSDLTRVARKAIAKNWQAYIHWDGGLQHNNQDKFWCGHHVLFWFLYRLKYGKFDTTSVHKFRTFHQQFETHNRDIARVLDYI